MKLKSIWLLLGSLFAFSPKQPPSSAPVAPAQSFHKITAVSIDGQNVSMSQYKGKKVLVVNVASKCGYTPQYADLQALQDKYKDKLVVLGFPSNEFMGQEPGSNQEIAQFCQKNYGVSFPLFEKTTVKKGKDQHPLYQWLTNKEANGWNEQDPSWNFCKYLIDEQGKLLKFYPSKVKPLDEQITSQI